MNKIGKKVDTDSISVRVYKTLKDLILAKQITGKINQEDIAETLGVSRTPVLYALNRLNAEGFLELIPYKGFFIKKYNPEEFSEMVEVRLLFESYGIEKLINNLTEKDIRILNRFIERFKKYYNSNDIAKYRSLDVSFHTYIVKKTNNKYIIKEYKDFIMMPMVSSGFIPLETSIEHHIKLVESIISKDLQKAKEEIKKHIESLILK